MNSLADYSSATSSWELLVHLFDRIQTGELATFDALQAYVAGLPEKARSKAILTRAFHCQRQLRSLPPDLEGSGPA